MNLVFLGPPGAGKGTLAKMISVEYTIPQISTGDIFRAAVKAQTDLGKKVKSIMDAGELVPDELTISLVRERLAAEDARKGYILDGFPRTIAQADGLASFSPVDMVINFQAPDEVLIQRLTGRRVCPVCGRIYHITNMPPRKEGICDDDGAALIIRDDDTLEAVQNRLLVYRRQTEPLIGYYRDRKLIRDIDSSQAPEDSFRQIKELVDSL